VLGFINPQALAGGTLRIHPELARAAIETTIAAPLGLSVEDAAWGIHTLANATMARAVRAVSTERGHDPREFSLLCFGGNGPVHGATLARLLELRRILIPPVPGLFSALGMLFPRIEHHYVHTLKRRLSDFDPAHFEQEFRKLETEGRKILSLEGFPASKHRFERLIDLRYLGASSEITVDFKSGALQLGSLARDFHRMHEQLYGYASPDEPIETMNIRVIARSGAGRIEPGRLRVRNEGNAHRPARNVYFGAGVGWSATAVLSRDDIKQSWRRGPLLIEEFDSTTVVPPGGRVRRIEYDLLDLELGR
jgi:N-methylhydantoinase A